MDVTSIITKDYEDKLNRAVGENKPNQSQSPAFGRKHEALSPKS
jgi:hypothetical protein